jgi:hypothetical protein
MFVRPGLGDPQQEGVHERLFICRDCNLGTADDKQIDNFMQ